jgi:hypothetical protein
MSGRKRRLISVAVGSRSGACPTGRTWRGPVLRFVAAVDLDQLLTVPVIRCGQLVAYLRAVVPPLHQTAPQLLTARVCTQWA